MEVNVNLFRVDGNPALVKAWLLRMLPELGWSRISKLVDSQKPFMLPIIWRPEDVS